MSNPFQRRDKKIKPPKIGIAPLAEDAHADTADETVDSAEVAAVDEASTDGPKPISSDEWESLITASVPVITVTDDSADDADETESTGDIELITDGPVVAVPVPSLDEFFGKEGAAWDEPVEHSDELATLDEVKESVKDASIGELIAEVTDGPAVSEEELRARFETVLANRAGTTVDPVPAESDDDESAEDDEAIDAEAEEPETDDEAEAVEAEASTDWDAPIVIGGVGGGLADDTDDGADQTLAEGIDQDEDEQPATNAEDEHTDELVAETAAVELPAVTAPEPISGFEAAALAIHTAEINYQYAVFSADGELELATYDPAEVNAYFEGHEVVDGEPQPVVQARAIRADYWAAVQWEAASPVEG